MPAKWNFGRQVCKGDQAGVGRGSQPLEPRSRGNLGNNWMSTSPGWQWPSHCFLPKVSYGVCEAGKAVEWTAQSNIKNSHVSSGPVCSWEAHRLSWTSGLGSRLCYQPARELGQIMWTKQSQSTPSVQHSRDLYLQRGVPVRSDGKCERRASPLFRGMESHLPLSLAKSKHSLSHCC